MRIIPELEPGEFGRAAATRIFLERDSTWPPSVNKKLGILFHMASGPDANMN